MNKILIVIPDATRKAHLREVLPRVLKKCQVSGVRCQVRIIAGTGLHKPHTKEELKKLVGGKVFSGYEVISHDQKKENLIYRGKTKAGIPIWLNKNVEWADEIATIGLIEPHLYAGYSGGAKTIAIGLAGEETINATHHPRFLDVPGTSIGLIKDNPFQDCLWEIIRGLPVKYSVSIVNDRKGNLKRVSIRELRGGISDFKMEFDKGVRFAKGVFEKKLDKSFDAVICKVTPPKDVNMYQASRAFNYVLNVKRPIVKHGGIVLVCASLKDGFGKGMGEKRFAAAMKDINSPKAFIKKIKRGGCVAGEHRAYMVAKAMTKARIGFIGPKAALYTKGLPFLSFPDVKSAIKFIKHTKGKTASVYTIQNALGAAVSKE